MMVKNLYYIGLKNGEFYLKPVHPSVISKKPPVEFDSELEQKYRDFQSEAAKWQRFFANLHNTIKVVNVPCGTQPSIQTIEDFNKRCH